MAGKTNYVIKEVKFWQGSLAEHADLISNGLIDNNTIYFVLADTDNSGNRIYLGNELMDDILYDKLNSGGDLPIEEIQKIIDAKINPIKEEVSTLTQDLDNIYQEVTGIQNTIVETVTQVVDEQLGGAIDAVIDEKVGPIVEEKINAVLGDITTDLETTKTLVGELNAKVDSIDNYTTVYSPILNTTYRYLNPITENFISLTNNIVEIGLKVYSDNNWHIKESVGYSLPTKITSNELAWNNMDVANTPLYPNVSDTVTKVYTYTEEMSSVDISLHGNEIGYKIIDGRIKYVDGVTVSTEKSSLPLWGNKWYKGTSKTKELTNDIIKVSGVGTLVPNKAESLKTLNTGVINNISKDDFYYIAYPETAGPLSVIALNNVQDISGGFELKKVTIVNEYGISQVYNAYITVYEGSIENGTSISTK